MKGIHYNIKGKTYIRSQDNIKNGDMVFDSKDGSYGKGYI